MASDHWSRSVLNAAREVERFHRASDLWFAHPLRCDAARTENHERGVVASGDCYHFARDLRDAERPCDRRIDASKNQLIAQERHV